LFTCESEQVVARGRQKRVSVEPRAEGRLAGQRLLDEPELCAGRMRFGFAQQSVVGRNWRRPPATPQSLAASLPARSAESWGMPNLTRRRSDNPHQETWHVYYGDVHVGSIGERAGVPVDVDQWSWNVGFYPLSHRGVCEQGTAPDMFKSRASFAAAWARLQLVVTDADLLEFRRQRARTAWKYHMWDCGCRMPTQNPSGRSRCFCGVEIDVAGASQHVYDAHMGMR
jgi:hypothetical protein